MNRLLKAMRKRCCQTSASAATMQSVGPHSSNQGFTLVEILLVIVLIALLATSVVPGVTNVFRVGVTSSVRRFAALVKYTYDQSILTGRIHRIVLNLDEQSWTVESAEVGALPIDKAKEELNRDHDGPPPEEPGFKKVGGTLVDKMPVGVQILKVESWRLGPKGASATKGEVSLYAYPSGYIDEATVVLAEAGKENVQRFKVTTQALTGRVKVETENPQ